MNTEKLFEKILRDGCGIDPQTITQSPEFQERFKEQETLFERYPITTDQGKMLRAGHITAGILLNSYPEHIALQNLGSEYSMFGHQTKYRAMITATGNAIIVAAKKMLPVEALTIAEKWKTASADEQIKLTKDLYFLFTTTSQRDKKEASYKNLLEGMGKSYSRYRAQGFNQVLPNGYGPWNRDTNPANCQGKTQLILAFADIVGAKTMTMLPNDISRDVLDNIRYQTSSRIHNDIRTRKIQFPDPQFMDSLECTIIEKENRDLLKSFHICPVIQVRDGRWVIIDSNALSWGVLSKKWKIDKMYKILNKYSEVLPGLCLAGSDYFQKKKIMKKITEEVDIYLSLSRSLEKSLESITGISELCDALSVSPEVDFAMKKTHGEEYEQLPKEYKGTVIIQALLGSAETMLSEMLNDHGNYLQKKKDCITTYFHCLAMDVIDDSWNEDGMIVHPDGYFSINNGYQIGIGVINSIGIDENIETTSFLFDHSFCQTTLHNAMMSKRFTPEVAEVAKKTLMQLSMVHPLSKRILNKQNI